MVPYHSYPVWMNQLKQQAATVLPIYKMLAFISKHNWTVTYTFILETFFFPHMNVNAEF